MKEPFNQIQHELTDGIFLGLLVLFAGWVALTQHAALGAPTTAICTAALLSPRVKSEHPTLMDQLYKPAVAVGTSLTAFQWLLSATQPVPASIPIDTVQAYVIQIGWILSIALIVTNPFVFLIIKLRRRREGNEQRNDRVVDYGSGMLCSFIAYALGWFMLDISKVIFFGGIDVPVSSTVILTISAPGFGWLVVFTERRRSARQNKKRPSEPSS